MRSASSGNPIVGGIVRTYAPKIEAVVDGYLEQTPDELDHDLRVALRTLGRLLSDDAPAVLVTPAGTAVLRPLPDDSLASWSVIHDGAAWDVLDLSPADGPVDVAITAGDELERLEEAVR